MNHGSQTVTIMPCHQAPCHLPHHGATLELNKIKDRRGIISSQEQYSDVSLVKIMKEIAIVAPQ